MKSENMNEIAAALAKAQGAMKNACLNKTNPHFKSKYADLAAVRDAIQKPLSENGLAYVQTVECRANGAVLLTTLLHSSGQYIESEYPLPATARPQEMGSALTYARRYSLSSLVGVSADEDDDANAANDAGQRIEAAGKAKPKPVPPKPDVSEGQASLSVLALDLMDQFDAINTIGELNAYGGTVATRVNGLPKHEAEIVRGHFAARKERLKQQAEALAA